MQLHKNVRSIRSIHVLADEQVRDKSDWLLIECNICSSGCLVSTSNNSDFIDNEPFNRELMIRDRFSLHTKRIEIGWKIIRID